jgi:hypothetical protein
MSQEIWIGRKVEGYFPKSHLSGAAEDYFRIAGHSDQNPNSGDAQVLGTKVRK